jgi:arylsulfatase A-like enzyme
VPTIFCWPTKLKPSIVNEPLDMVDVMPTVLALAGGRAARTTPLMAKTSGRLWRRTNRRLMKTC